MDGVATGRMTHEHSGSSQSVVDVAIDDPSATAQWNQ